MTPKAAFTSTADKLFQITGAYMYDSVHHKQCGKQCLVQQTYLKPPVHVQEYFCLQSFCLQTSFFYPCTLANVYQSLQKKKHLTRSSNRRTDN